MLLYIDTTRCTLRSYAPKVSPCETWRRMPGATTIREIVTSTGHPSFVRATELHIAQCLADHRDIGKRYYDWKDLFGTRVVENFGRTTSVPLRRRRWIRRIRACRTAGARTMQR